MQLVVMFAYYCITFHAVWYFTAE